MIKMDLIESVEAEMQALKKIVECEFGLLDLFKLTRKREYIDARMIYSKILRDRGHSLSSIGRSMNKDHATIINYVTKADYLIKQEAKLRERYTTCRSYFLQNREPVFKNPTQRDLINKITSLTNQLEQYITEREKVIYWEKQYKRLYNIINLLNERVGEGKERAAERKIRNVLNSF